MFNWVSNKRRKKEFEEQIIEHLDSLYNAAMRMTQNRQDAEDLVQETSLRAYRFFHKFKAGTNFKAWTLTILRNIYINAYRKKAKEPAKVQFEEVENFISLPEVTGGQEEIFSETIKDSIAKLPEELRTILTLFYLEDFSYKEIARIMDVPTGTVMSRLYRARQILKKQLPILSMSSKRRGRDEL